MKIVVIFAIALAVLGAYAIALRHSVAQVPSAAKESPFYCNRQAIDSTQIHRKEEIGQILHSRRKSIREIGDGYEFELPGDPSTIEMAAQWATLERLCCPFFEIDLRMEREGGPLWLRLSGREGVKQFIRGELVHWFAGERQ